MDLRNIVNVGVMLLHLISIDLTRPVKTILRAVWQSIYTIHKLDRDMAYVQVSRN